MIHTMNEHEDMYIHISPENFHFFEDIPGYRILNTFYGNVIRIPNTKENVNRVLLTSALLGGTQSILRKDFLL